MAIIRLHTPSEAAGRPEDWDIGSEMGNAVLTHDWASTELGPIDGWPRSLRTMVEVMLRSPFQMAIYWGPLLRCLYNDAERLVLGELHPRALGLPARELLRHAWTTVGPQLRRVMERAETTWAKDAPLTFNRWGRLDVGYFTYSYSPSPDDAGDVGGVLLITQETTDRVLAERRTVLLRRLPECGLRAGSVRESAPLTADALISPDIPFAALYLAEPDGKRLTRVAAAGSELPMLPSPTLVDLQELARESGPRPMRDGVAYMLPIRTADRSSIGGVLVMGTNPECRFDSAYARFLELAGLGLERNLTAARSRELQQEHVRAQARDAEQRALLGDLRAARRRAVVAADRERQRIERDLHDGAQQTLISMRLELAMAKDLLERGHASTAAKLDEVSAMVDGALEELRDLAQGVYPALLASDGVATALLSSARKMPMPVAVKATGRARAPRSLETAVYFCCLEALQNAAKHAGPDASATVELNLSHGALEFCVRDDGVGFDTRTRPEGRGLVNLRDRVAALGGRLAVVSAPGAGTRVAGEIPLP